MKKNLFTKFLALFLSGLMLTVVGCKDYDDDINNLQKQIDGLKTGEIATMQSQITAMQSTIAALTAADEAMKTRIAALETDNTANKAAIEALKTAQAGIQTEIQNIKDNYVTKTLLTTTLSSYATTASVAKAIALAEGLKVYVTDAAIDDAIAKAKAEAIAAAGEAASAAFAEAIKAYSTTEQMNKAIEDAINEYDAKIQDQLTKAVEAGGFIDVAIATAMETAGQNLEAAIGKLNADVKTLAARVQSLVYVPAYSDGSTDLKVNSLGDIAATANSFTMKFRVAPAALAEEMESLMPNLTLIGEEVTTRAAGDAAVATITGVEVVDATLGTFTVSGYFATTPELASTTIALALKKSVMGTSDTTTELGNDVVSNFGVLTKLPTVAAQFALLDSKGAPVGAEVNYAMPWNTPIASSTVTLLDGYTLMASLDGGTTYMTLAEASAVLGKTIAPSTYTVAANAYENTTNTDGAALFTTVVSSRVWPTTLATATLKKAATAADVTKAVTNVHTLKVKVGTTDVATLPTVKTRYQITNKNGGEMTWAAASTNLKWTYDFVSVGNTQFVDPTPAVPATQFGQGGEVAITGVPAAPSLSTIMGYPVTVTVTPTPSTATVPDVTLTHVASQLATGVSFTMDANYDWGASYAVKAVYYDAVTQTEYTISGTITTAAAPADITMAYAQKSIAYDSVAGAGGLLKNEGAWADVYAKATAGQFADQAQFLGAVYTNSPAPVIATKRYTAATGTAGETVIGNGNGTTMTYAITPVATAKPTGIVSKLDVLAANNRFEQSMVTTTWYGQKVTVSMNTLVTMPTYTLAPNSTFVSNNVVNVNGMVNPATNLWEWASADCVDYYTLSPASVDGSVAFAKKSVDGKKLDGTGTEAGTVYATVGGTPKYSINWAVAGINRASVMVTATASVNALQVATQDFTVNAIKPIVSITQASALQKQYVSGAGVTFNLLEGLSMMDAQSPSKNWIEVNKVDPDDSSTWVWQPVLSGANGPKTVFAATTGTAANAAGITFEFVTPADATNYGLVITENTLTSTINNAVPNNDQTIAIKATWKNGLGQETTGTLSVTIKK